MNTPHMLPENTFSIEERLEISLKAIEKLQTFTGELSLYYKSENAFKLYRLKTIEDMQELYREDISTLDRALKTETDGALKHHLMKKKKSLEDKLIVGIGNSVTYTCKDTYTNVSTSIKMHKETNILYLTALVLHSITLETYYPTRKKENPLHHLHLNCDRIRMFKLSTYKVVDTEDEQNGFIMANYL